MTMMKPVLEIVIDANILILLAFLLWYGVQSVLRLTRLRYDFSARLALLKLCLVLVLLSPALAKGGAWLGDMLWPGMPVTASDLAVKAYLSGGIGISAVDFEAMLNTRDRWTDFILSGQSPWLTVALALLVTGMIWQAGRLGHSVWALRRALDSSFVWRQTRRVDIRLSDRVSVPFAARGVWRSHVVLPSSLVTHPRDMRFILAHEFQHLRAGDVEWEIALEALRPVLFWNPAFLAWKRAFDRLRELSCDQKVVTRRGISVREYSACLLDFCERRVAQGLPRAMNVAFGRSTDSTGSPAKRDLQSRLLALRHAPGTRHVLALPGIAVCLALAITVLSITAQPSAGDWSHDRLMLSTVVNLERLEQINSSR